MSYIILCNTGSDSLSKINTENLKVQNLYLSTGENPFGPHGLSLYKDKILVANNYNNSISVIDLNGFNEENNVYIGAHPNDIVTYNDTAYVSCGESDSVIVYDLVNQRVDFELPTGRFPHSMSLFDEKNIIFISNMWEDSISVIDCKNNKEIKRIKVGDNPMKIIISNNKKYLYVCMSYIETGIKGSIAIISLNNFEVIAKINVGFAPVDLFEDGNYLYVSNLYGGSISIINLKELKQKKIIKVTGMPRGIIKENENIYIGDYLNGSLIIMDIKNNTLREIEIGKEPNAMTLINN